jgi:hypothetical protein
MLERPAKGIGASVRAKALLVLLGVTALAAYYVGRQSSHVGNAPVAAVAQPQHPVAKLVAFTTSVSPSIAAAATSSASNNPATSIKTRPEKVAASSRSHKGGGREVSAPPSPATKP